MDEPCGGTNRGRRWLRLVGVAAAVAVGASVLVLVPYYYVALAGFLMRGLPMPVVAAVQRAGPLPHLAAAAAIVALRPERRLGRWFRRVSRFDPDRAAGRALDRWASALLGGACLVVAATWLPHYLAWPWWADAGYFAVSAQAWDSGILPYRDLHDFNFPGPTYVHWVLGKAFGWGRTPAFYAVDAAFLALLGWTATRWSAARLGGPVPGLVACAAWLFHYAGLDFALVAQRDWHATGLAVLSILLLETRSDKAGLIGSAAAFAAALAIRPYPVIFAPAILSALDEHARSRGGTFRETVKAGIAWSAAAAVGLALAAAPLFAAGIADDLFRALRTASAEGTYRAEGRPGLAAHLANEFSLFRIQFVCVLLIVLWIVGPAASGRAARTWLTALSLSLLYKPLGPVPHDYLDQPSRLVWCVGLGLGASLFARPSRLRPAIRLLALAAVLIEAIPARPAFCDLFAALDGAVSLARGRPPRVAPPGARSRYRGLNSDAPIHWSEYQGTLDYLRTRVGPRTPVANFLNFEPYPALNGPAGRLPAFPSPGGFLWLRKAAPGMEREFAEALLKPADAVVVWRPGPKYKDVSLHLPEIAETIARAYEFEARIGRIEIWRRKPTRTRAGPSTTANTEAEHGTRR